MSILGLVLVAVLVIVGGRWLHQRLERQKPKNRERAELRELLLECNGDDHLAQRLIFLEMQRDGDLNFEQAAKRARHRLKRDRN